MNRTLRGAARSSTRSPGPARRAAALRLEILEARDNPAPLATVTAPGNVNPFLGTPADFTFNYTNAGTTTGFSPFIDVILDTSGPDGTSNLPPGGLNPTAPGNASDGFGTPVVTAAGLAMIPVGTPIVLSAGQTTYTNPFTGQVLPVPAQYGAGDTIFTYQLPFGSFTPGQSTAVAVSAPVSALADVGTNLPITVRPGFRDTDGDANAPLVPAVGADASGAANPKLWDLRKVYTGPENETATGPNYVRRYRLEVDIAPGQTLQNLQVTDDLGASMQIVGRNATNMAAFLASSGLSTNVFAGANLTGSAVAGAPDGTLTYTFGSVTGVAGVDAVFEFDFFVPRDGSNGTVGNTADDVEVLPQPTPPLPNPGGGTDSAFDTNTATGSANWNPVDSRDPQNQTVTKTAPDNGTHQLQEHSVAVQKSVTPVTVANPNTPAPGPLQPGQTLLRYTINFQVSDYYAVNDLFVNDVLGDGQRLFLQPGFAPTLTVQNPWTFAGGAQRAPDSTGAFAGGNTIDFERRYTIRGTADSDPTVGIEGYAATGPTGGPFSAPTAGTIDGSTFLRFNVSQELVARGLSGLLVGGEVANGGGNPQNLATPPFGPAQGTITFWVITKEEYSDNFPSGDRSVDQGDSLTNSVPLIQGDHLLTTDLADGTPTDLGTQGTDNSGTTITVGRGQQTKTIFAINGVPIPTQTAADTVFSVQAGDRITYKLTYTLPSSRFEDLALLDIPPLPVMPVGPAAQYTFDRDFDGSADPFEIEVASDDTFFSTFNGLSGNPLFPSLVPGTTITTTPGTNTLTLSFGDFDDLQDRFTTISLLVTLPIGPQSFVGDLFLTNQLRVNEGNTFLGVSTVEDLRRVQLVRPTVTIDKGVVGFDTTGRTLGGIGFTAPGEPPTGASTPAFTGTVDTAGEADAIGGANIGVTDGVDAGDRVRFGLVAQNTSLGDAFNVIIEDQVQPGFVIPPTFGGLNLNVRRGDGTLLTNFSEVQAFARVATAGALTGPGAGPAFNLTGGGQFTNVDQIIDGVSVSLNDLVVVKDQATASQNGVYQVTAVDANTGTVTLTRDAGFDTAGELSGAAVAVMGGNTSADRFFQIGAVGTLNADPVNFAIQAATQDYYVIYNSTTGAFRILLSDNYTTGNVNDATRSRDDRSGGLSRAGSAPPVNAGDTPTITPVTNGSNSVVVQYDLTLAAGVAPNQTIINTGRVPSYTSGEAGPDLTDPNVVEGGADPTDMATVVTALPRTAKAITATGVTEPGNNNIQASPFLAQATIGELVEFEVVVTVPEGVTPGAIIVDTLDAGLAFVDVTQVTVTAGLTVSGLPTVGSTPANTSIGTGGQTITFNLGTLTNNTNGNNAGGETITIRYRAVVLNEIANQAGQTRNNSAQFAWTGNPTRVDAVQAGQQTGAGGTATGTPQQVTVVEPTLTVPKTVNNVTDGTGFQELVSADAGDTVQYRLLLTNGSAATDTTAFDVTLSDPLPAPLSAPTLFSVASTGTIRFNGIARPAQVSDFVITGGTVQVAAGINIDMQPGSTITVVVQGTWTGAFGAVVTNTATLDWTSLDGVPTNTQYNAAGVERTGADGVGAGLNNYRATDTADVESPPLVRKTIVATSEPHTTPNPITVPGVTAAQGAIGEVVRYRLYTGIAEGSAVNVQVQDFLPAGTRFLNDGSARWAFVASAAGRITSTANGPIAALGSSPTAIGDGTTLATLASSAISGTFGDSNVATAFGGAGTGEGSLFASGQDVFFRFGNVANLDNDANGEFIVIEFNALVENITGNQAGTLLSNDFGVLVDTDANGTPGYISVLRDTDGSGTASTGDVAAPATDADNDASDAGDVAGTSNAAVVTVVEPALAIDKVVVATTGSVVTYRLTLTNTGTNATTAFNSVVRDVLNGTNLTLVSGSVTTALAGGAAGATNTSSGNTLSVTLDTLPVGGSLVVTYQANVLTAPTGTTTLNNTATATTTGLPGTNGSIDTTPFFGTAAATLGGSGTPTGERTGADGIGGALNDYAVTDSAALGSLGNRVFVDHDADGVQDMGEPGVRNAPVTVRWAGPDGIFDNGDDSVITATTGADGLYTVTGLPVDSPGAFRVTVNDTGAPFTTFGLNTVTDAVENGAVNATNTSTVSLTAAAPNPRDQDFGYRGTASIGDRVWLDQDGDGTQDPGEPGLTNIGVTVTWLGQDGVLGGGDDLVVTTTTGPDGIWNVSNLPAGSYTVAVNTANLPTNVAQTFDLDGIGTAHTATTTLTTGQNRTDVDFGYRGNASVGDRVWIDQDRDGIQDPTEPGIPGAAVQLRWAGFDGVLDTADDILLTATTGTNGTYLFDGLPVYGSTDDYRVTVTALPIAGLTPTFDLDSGTTAPNQTATFVVSGVEGNALNDRRDVDFGYDGLGGLSGRVYHDLNNNGVQDAGEPGIPGAILTLTGVDVLGNPVLNPATGAPFTATTDANGDYSFPTVVPGTYTITEAQPAGFNDGIDTSGTLGGNPGNDVISGVVVGPNQDGTQYNFGEVGTTLSGTVFNDRDRDGTLDPGEPGIPGVTVQLFAADGVTPILNPATGTPYIVTTDATGNYAFTDIPAGSYVVRETQPAGYADSPVGPTTTRPVTVPLGGLTEQNFGEVLGSLAGRVYVDSNNNGTQQTGELPLANIAVTLTGADVNGNPVNRTVFTDANGEYRFDDLFPANGTGYTITEGPAAPFADAVNNAPGSLGGTVGTNTFTGIPLAAGQQGASYNFGERPPATTFLAGSVYIDQDRDGVRDPGETSIPGVTVTLVGAGPDGAIGTTDDTTTAATTGPNGEYLFDNLIPGQSYRLIESQPGAFGSSTPNTINVPPLPATGLTNQNFGETVGSLAGSVYFDANRSGTRGPGEPGIAGVTVTLTGTDVNGNPVTRTTTTDASGNYLFTDLLAGTYVVSEPTQPAGFADGTEALGTSGGRAGNDTFTAVPLGGGVNATGYDFGEVGVPVSGRVFQDRDRDGTLDAGELPIPGVTVQLIDANGTVVATTTTAPDGTYTFPNVAPGSYTIREVQPAGFGNPLVGPFAPDTRPITVAGTPVVDQNFANTLSTLSGSVYVDANNDGVRQGGEAGIPGVPVALDSSGPDGQFGTADDLLNFRTATTDGNGNYTFADLPSGTYRVRETAQPAPFTDGRDTAGSAGGNTGTNDQIGAVPVGAGVDLTGYNFGELPPAAPFISGVVYIDANNNGVRDPGEAPVAGVTVTLTGPGGGTTVTDANGNYLFTGLTAGANYTVAETQPTGLGDGPENPGNVITVNALPATGSVNNNFGEVAGFIAGTVYFDQNNSGALNAGDTRLPGVTVQLFSAGTDGILGNGDDVLVATTQTDATGDYRFDNLRGGGYRVVETQPANFNQGTNTPGTGSTLGGLDRLDVALPAGGGSPGNNFGELGATISGRVWVDTNRDGVRQPGEATNLGGVIITLLDANGTVVGTTTTAADGTYSFTNLPPGSYTIVQTQPNQFGSTTANTIPVSLTAAGVTDQNFGEVLGSLAGSVFSDVNNDGTRGPGEPGIAGVAVTLTGTDVNGNPVNRTTTTDADGNYLFTDLPAGTYTATEAQPTAYLDGREQVGSAGGSAATNDVFAAVPIGAGVNATGYNFGELGSSLSGFVYRDFDLNTTRTVGGANPDTGIPGITITLTGTTMDGTPVTRTTVTGPDGSYRFDGLGAGNYVITETQPGLPVSLTQGFYDGADNLGSLGGTQPAKNQLAVTLGPVQNGVNYNFGELPPADPFGFVFIDANNNGVRDAGEAGIPNVEITLSGTAFAGTPFARPVAPGDVPGGSLTVRTDASGFYQFNPIPPGLYTIRQTQPAGFIDGAEENGDPSGPAPTIGNDVFSNLLLSPFPVRGPFNFGERVPATPARPVTPPMPMDQVNKGMFLSSTPDALVNMPTAPQFTNSIGRLGIASSVTSVGVAVGADAGQPAQVRLFDFRTATERLSFEPFVGFRGGVRVATGDINGDGIEDVVVAAGPGAGPHVKAFDGRSAAELFSFFAYDPGYLGGVSVAVGDVNGDGFADVVTSAGPGVGPHVKAFDGRSAAELFSFFAYDPGYLGGVSVAVGDVNGDGFADVVTGSGVGVAPHVKAFNGRDAGELSSFLAFAPGFVGGVNVAVGDTNGDGVGEVVATAASGSSSHVVIRELSGQNRQLQSFFAWPGFGGNGLRAAVADINGDRVSDVVLGSGPGGATRVSVLDGRTQMLLDDFFAFDPYGPGGVYVG